jgi:hypothetical protein
MIQVHACVSVHCDQCGDALGDPGFEEHYPTERSAFGAAAARGWRIGPARRWWCSACAPALTCQSEGHQFSQWRHPLTADGHLAGSEYRHCRRCCQHESRPAEPGLGEGGEGTDAGEVH